MSDFYTASDYAGLSGGRFSFYYGYEEADIDDNWSFTAKIDGNLVYSAKAKDLGLNQFDDPSLVLMAGIARFLDFYDD